MKKLITLLIILIPFCELKAQNKHYEFTVVKPESDINVFFDLEYMVVGNPYGAQFTTEHKDRKYRFSFSHGTVARNNEYLVLWPKKAGNGVISIYEFVHKEYFLVKEIPIAIIDIKGQ